MEVIQVIQDIQEYRTLEDQYTLYSAVQKVQRDHIRILCQTAGVQPNGVSICPQAIYVGSVQ